MAKGLTLEDISKQTGGDQEMVSRAKISLGHIEKSSQQAGVDLTNGLMECGFQIDSSYSLRGAYINGSVQETASCGIAWASLVDGSGDAEAGFFDSVAHQPKKISLANYNGWVEKHRPDFGGTNLYDAIVMGAKMAADALKTPQILDLIMAEVPDGSSGGLFSRKSGTKQQPGLTEEGGHYLVDLKDLKPVQTDKMYYLTIITDGAPMQGPRPYKDTIKELITRLSYACIFIKFIFVGTDENGRKFLELLDDMATMTHEKDLADPADREDPRHEYVPWKPGVRYADNVDKVEFPGGLASVSREDFAAAMTQELDGYVPSAFRRGLLTGKYLVQA